MWIVWAVSTALKSATDILGRPVGELCPEVRERLDPAIVRHDSDVNQTYSCLMTCPLRSLKMGNMVVRSATKQIRNSASLPRTSSSTSLLSSQRQLVWLQTTMS
jgi:hypothetical protein